jgi:hypothetical protein
MGLPVQPGSAVGAGVYASLYGAVALGASRLPPSEYKSEYGEPDKTQEEPNYSRQKIVLHPAGQGCCVAD